MYSYTKSLSSFCSQNPTSPTKFLWCKRENKANSDLPNEFDQVLPLLIATSRPSMSLPLYSTIPKPPVPILLSNEKLLVAALSSSRVNNNPGKLLVAGSSSAWVTGISSARVNNPLAKCLFAFDTAFVNRAATVLIALSSAWTRDDSKSASVALLLLMALSTNEAKLRTRDSPKMDPVSLLMALSTAQLKLLASSVTSMLSTISVSILFDLAEALSTYVIYRHQSTYIHIYIN
ncbi:hypothetical protein D0Y65_036975 [Glycine soja]|uniref:Uncharacterized protein n=1 Tax=Glycine soja TaxID=3848 RepID=A0A445HHD2_GLYSO|nr:hypothetical protein D0Y65_036975 [Glycine soja]